MAESKAATAGRRGRQAFARTASRREQGGYRPVVSPPRMPPASKMAQPPDRAAGARKGAGAPDDPDAGERG